MKLGSHRKEKTDSSFRNYGQDKETFKECAVSQRGREMRNQTVCFSGGGISRQRRFQCKTPNGGDF